MAGRKGQKRGPSKDSIALARYQSKELNEVLNVKSSQLLQSVMSGAAEKKDAAALAELVKTAFVDVLQFVTDMRPNAITLKQVGINAPEDEEEDEDNED